MVGCFFNETNMNEFKRISKGTEAFLKNKYGNDIVFNPYTNEMRKGTKTLPVGQWGGFWDIIMTERENAKKHGKRYFIDKLTLIKSEANIQNDSQKSDKERKPYKKREKLNMLYTEIDNDFPFEIFDDIKEAERSYRRGYTIEFENKPTRFSEMAEEFYNSSSCDKHKLNNILYVIYKNKDYINEHRWTLQMFQRVAYVAMCKYYGIKVKDDDLTDNWKLYSKDAVIFNVLICKCFTTRCDFVNIVDEFGYDWDWPEDEKSICETPADCRCLPVARPWRNRRKNEFLLNMIPKEVEKYIK